MMMSSLVPCSAVAVLLLLSSGCGGYSPTSPTETAPPPTALPAPTRPPQTNFPSLTGPSRTFVFDRELSYRVSNYTKESRFVLYDNGAFVLEYPGLGRLRGGYTEANGVIVFEWEGWSGAGPWGATGTLKDDSLTVEYNVIMQLTDFEDALYVRTD